MEALSDSSAILVAVKGVLDKSFGTLENNLDLNVFRGLNQAALKQLVYPAPGMAEPPGTSRFVTKPETNYRASVDGDAE